MTERTGGVRGQVGFSHVGARSKSEGKESQDRAGIQMLSPAAQVLVEVCSAIEHSAHVAERVDFPQGELLVERR